MKKLVGLLPFLFLAGCSSLAISNSNSAENKYIVNDEIQFEVGNSVNSLGTLQFTLTRSNKVSPNRIVHINFDTLPFQSTFDLCEKNGTYNDLKSIVTNSSGESSPNYESKKIDCKSEVIIRHNSEGGYTVSYDLKFLDGYRAVSQKGFDSLLPITIHRLTTNRFVEQSEISVVNSRTLINLDI